MITGHPEVFALEARISRAYSRLSLLALGYFVIYVNGRRFGVFQEEATLLACSLDAVQQRIAARGHHVAPFADRCPAAEIAEAFYEAIYTNCPSEHFLEIPAPEFRSIFLADPNKCMWAPDGDAAFDDGSYVLQFDVAERVRIIAFRSAPGCQIDPGTLTEVWLNSDSFYTTLHVWVEGFEESWASMPKAPERTSE